MKRTKFYPISELLCHLYVIFCNEAADFLSVHYCVVIVTAMKQWTFDQTFHQLV